MQNSVFRERLDSQLRDGFVACKLELGMDETCIVVLTAVGTRQFASDLANSIVSARLAACVQIQPVQSVYRWKGEVRSEPEWLLAIKTTAEIVKVPIAGGSREYLGWVAESVR